ncbi:FecR family protein [Hyalangium rubrum]|uniref:FecR family protein n=1 Tax=Hyalangium rubrum TaxID=3103134 RepID=A0ABU5H6P3_9BACT|nr:FecR family protein [Hyalangium sp. s54d21]MDY7228759.1 FecR family protein [Hyalangium sp. s54d21]
MLLALALSAMPFGCTADEKPPAPSATPPKAPEPRAHLREVRGDVKLKRVVGDEWISAQDGMPLFENDKVRTAAGASARIVFGNGGRVNLGEDALIGIAETRPRPGQQRTDLTLLKGQVDAALETPSTQSLSVSTPSATVQAGREIVFQ